MCFGNHRTEFEIVRSILTCLNKCKELSVRDPDYREASLKKLSFQSNEF